MTLLHFKKCFAIRETEIFYKFKSFKSVMWCPAYSSQWYDVMLIQVNDVTSFQETFCDKKDWNILLIQVIQVSDVMSCLFKAQWNRAKVQGIVYLGECTRGKERARALSSLAVQSHECGLGGRALETPFCLRTVPRIWPSHGADKSSSQRQSLSGSQWGSCSTAYNTPAGT